MALNTIVVIVSTSALHHGIRPDRRAASAPQLSRRDFAGLALGCGCWACAAPTADALAALAPPPLELQSKFDLPRDKMKDAGFAYGMSVGMVDYEAAVAPSKKELFAKMLSALPARTDALVVELGMGSFPNAPYYQASRAPLDIVGVDPNGPRSESTYVLLHTRSELTSGALVSRRLDGLLRQAISRSAPQGRLLSPRYSRYVWPGDRRLITFNHRFPANVCCCCLDPSLERPDCDPSLERPDC